MSRRQYAAHRSVTRQAIDYAVKSGAIPVRADGKIDSKRADAIWTPQPRRPVGSGRASKATAAASPAPPPADDAASPAPAPASVDAATPKPAEPATPAERIALVKAEAAEYAWRIKRGELDEQAKARFVAAVDSLSSLVLELLDGLHDRLVEGATALGVADHAAFSIAIEDFTRARRAELATKVRALRTGP